MLIKEYKNVRSARKSIRALSLLARTSVLSLSFGAAGAALAQSATPATNDPSPAAPAPAADNALGDIVVTARRVSERLQDIPASVTAITGDSVSQLTKISDLQSQVSGLTFANQGTTLFVGLRGYGNRASIGTANSTVGIFQDGVFLDPLLTTMITRVDTERVEVAKGPQSLLYGRSTFTGAINIVSNDPTSKPSGYIDAGYGGSSVHGENLWHVEGAISGPLTDTLSVRAFALREKRDGYTYDSVTGNRGDGYDRKIGRIKLKWQPSDVVTARLTGTILRDNQSAANVHAAELLPPLGQRVLFGPANSTVNAGLVFGPTVWDAAYAEPQTGKTEGGEITLDLRFNTPMGELASLTDWQHAHTITRQSADVTRADIAMGNTEFKDDRWSQELRLANKIGRVSYLAGVYYQQSIARQGGNGQTLDLDSPQLIFKPGASLYDGPFHVRELFTPTYTKTQSAAAFAQIGYDITDKLNLTGGLRYSNDTLSGPSGQYLLTTNNFVVPFPGTFQRHGSFDSLTGGANLSYRIKTDVIAYASFTKGNSPGGLNTAAASAFNYAPQKVDAYEVGLKSQLLDRHLRLNIALFDNQYANLQLLQSVFVNGAPLQLTTNAAKAYGRGVDLDATAVVSSNWRFNVQYTYSKSKISQYVIPPAPAPQVNFDGISLVRSPRNTANGSVTYMHDIGLGKFQFTAEESYTSSYNNDYQGAPAGSPIDVVPGRLAGGTTTTQVLALFRTPGFALTNLNASYSLGHWEVRGFVRNLFNHQYIVAASGADVYSAPSALPGEPRTFEVSARYSF